MRLPRGAVAPVVIFMYENAKPHKTHIAYVFLEENASPYEFSLDISKLQSYLKFLGGSRMSHCSAQSPTQDTRRVKSVVFEEWTLLRKKYCHTHKKHENSL